MFHEGPGALLPAEEFGGGSCQKQVAAGRVKGPGAGLLCLWFSSCRWVGTTRP